MEIAPPHKKSKAVIDIDKRQYTRGTNSFMCTICHEYHQTSKNGKCKNLRAGIPLITDFLERNDLNRDTEFASSKTSNCYTELAFRRLMAVLQEHETEFREWTKESSSELPMNHTGTIELEKKNIEVFDAPELLSYEYLKRIDLIKF